MVIDVDFRSFSGLSSRREAVVCHVVTRKVHCMEVLGLQSGVDGDQQRSRLTRISGCKRQVM